MSSTGSISSAMYCLLGFYILCIALTAKCYLAPRLRPAHPDLEPAPAAV